MSSETVNVVFLVAVIPLVGCPVDGGTLPSGTNEPPSAAVVAMAPPEPTTDDALTITLLAESVDPEGGEVLYRVDWFLDNAPRSDLQDLWSVDATQTAKGQLWLAQVTPRDGDGAAGPVASATATIANTPPSVNLSLTPATPNTTSSLAATIVFNDVDDDVVSGEPTWTLDGNPMPAFDGFQTIGSDETARGQGWAVTVVPFDGAEVGASVTESVDIANSPPDFGNVVLAPSAAYEGDILTVSYDLPSDADEDPLDVTLSWHVNGHEVPGETTTSLTADHFDKNETVRCAVSVSDGMEAVVIDSDEITVLNSPPSQPVVSVSPAEPQPEDDLVCSIDQSSTDADGDAIVESIAWLVDAGATVFTGISIPASATSDGEMWTCEVTPNDGDEDGAAGLASVFVSVCPVWYSDTDGDGFGDPATAQVTCTQPAGTVTDGTDCDDQSGDVYPGAVEICGGADFDCDGVVALPCYTSCQDLLDNGLSTGDGVYSVDVDGAGPEAPESVYCDMSTDGGGWTLLQRTIWDSSATSVLRTGYADWYGVTYGDASSGQVFRLAGKHWSGLAVLPEHMYVEEIRKATTGLSCSPLYFIGTGGSFSITPSSASVGSISSGLPTFFRGSTLSASNSNNCYSLGGIPWFYGNCCHVCPRFAGNYFASPRPMEGGSFSAYDLYGNNRSSACGSDPPQESNASGSGVVGLNVLEYYVR